MSSKDPCAEAAAERARRDDHAVLARAIARDRTNAGSTQSELSGFREGANHVRGSDALRRCIDRGWIEELARADRYRITLEGYRAAAVQPPLHRLGEVV